MRIDRALIIRREQVELSKEYAQICIDSCVDHGLPYEIIEAVEFLSCDDAFKSVGVKKKPTYTNTQGNCCCHASHIKAWQRIIELDKACLILEHDAVVKGDVRNIDIIDMAVNTFGHRVSNLDDYTPIGHAEKMVEIPRSVGVHACALTPNTAKWLLNKAETEGVSIGIDRWLMMLRKSGLPLYVCDPAQVVCWVRTSTSNFNKGDPEVRKLKKGQITNYPDSLTESWKRGLR